MADAEVLAARAKLAQKFAAGNGGQIGGKGSVRRKKTAVHKASAVDDKKLQTTLKRLAVNTIPGIEEAVLFKDDGSAIYFESPKVQASLPANTFVVSGTPQTKDQSELSMGGATSSAAQQAAIAQMMKQLQQSGGKVDPSMFGAAAAAGAADDEEEDDDDMPALEQNFEAVSKK